MYFETFVINLRHVHSAGLTIVNKDVLPSSFWLLLYQCLRDIRTLGKTKLAEEGVNEPSTSTTPLNQQNLYDHIAKH